MKTHIQKDRKGWKLLVDGNPFFIRGAVSGRKRLKRLAELGANAIRCPRIDREVLDLAHSAGLGVLAGLPVRPERNGMDYEDKDAVETMCRETLQVVKEFRDHPAILMWCVGNELDHIPKREDFNPKVWLAVNEIARRIHKVDPDHPAMTAVGMGRFGKIKGCVESCPELDLIGINAYGNVDQVDSLLREHGWNKPYVITEWGMTGSWQRPKTEWGAPFEECSTTKAQCYRRRYQTSILPYPDRCLGSFAFYWGWRHETTLSYYNTWVPDGSEMETVEVWRELWTGQPCDPELPHLYGVRVNHFAAPDSVYLKPGQRVPIEAMQDDNARLPGMRYVWELRPEVEYGAYAGGGEVLPDLIPDSIETVQGGHAKLIAPSVPGKYRLFAFLYDRQNRVATANLPFLVEEEAG